MAHAEIFHQPHCRREARHRLPEGNRNRLKENQRATMIYMKRPAASEPEAILAIVRIIKEQQALERHQRGQKASFETIQRSMVDAYSDIVSVLALFMQEPD